MQLILALIVACQVESPLLAAPCRIEVVEKGSDWPVPLIELRTTNDLRFVTDNAGVIVINQPELMGREVFFHVEGHGYEVPADGFGYRGVRLTPRAGVTLHVEVDRTIIAQRLGRLTRAGQFANAQRVGQETEWRESGVVGSDSVQTAVYRGRHFWLWGDTSLFHYPLGIFHSSAATTELGSLESFKPPLRVKYDYFRNDQGRPRGVAKMPGDGPTWLSAMTTLPDKDGTPHLIASYAKIKPPLDAYEKGLCVWNDESQNFERLQVVWSKSGKVQKSPPMPDGHPTFWTDEAGKKWVLFGNPLPALKCPATFEAWQDPSQWESLEPQKSLTSATDNSEVRPHTGSITWNPWRKRWVTIFMQWFGKPSAFGELWYAESDQPTGSWGSCVKVLSHQNYTFYNPRIHPEFTPDDSPILLFEGTYTQQFADKPHPTARYDYNQILYRLDLNDERLKPAQLRR
ncbi:MAG: hypothetical protein O3B68_14030 [Planctomycetota bacterium]|nr:hypothetical protein [Planctomycetota bacterium]